MARRGRARIDGVHIAYIAILAAACTITAYIPAFPVIGVGGTMSAGMFVVPLVGVLLGPTAGTLAAAIGAFLGQIVAPYGAVFGLITFLCPMVGAAVAGLLAFKKWRHAAVVLGGLILLWYVITSILWAGDPRAYIRWYFPFLHIASFISVIALRGRIGDWIVSGDLKKLPFGIFFAALAGLLSEHMVGNSIYITLYSGPAGPFSFVITIYWIERLLGAIGATLIGTPLAIALSRARLELGPWGLPDRG